MRIITNITMNMGMGAAAGMSTIMSMRKAVAAGVDTIMSMGKAVAADMGTIMNTVRDAAGGITMRSIPMNTIMDITSISRNILTNRVTVKRKS